MLADGDAVAGAQSWVKPRAKPLALKILPVSD